jgi:hypothetical protein
MFVRPQPRSALLMVASLLLPPAPATAQQAGCAELQALKKQAYGFRPSKLTEPQQAAREQQIDRFRRLAESQGEPAVRCLRGMLQSEKTDSFFLFDGASLLLHLDDSPPSLAVVSDAVKRSDLVEINPVAYLETVLLLAQRGVDTGPLAEKYVKYPNVDGYDAEHSFPVDRATGATFLYGSMDPVNADKYLVPLLGAKETYVHSTAALELALNMTEESYRALAGMPGIDHLPEYVQKEVVETLAYHAPADNVIPAYSREQVLARLRTLPRKPEQVEAELEKETPLVGIANDEPFIRSAIATLNATDLEALRDARRTALMSVSEESLEEYTAYTRIILGVINRLDLYKEFRVH